MAFNPAPEEWIGDYVYDSELDTITINRETFFGSSLSPENCNGTTGNILEIIRAFVAQFKANFDAANAADRPANLVITRSLGIIRATSQIGETFRLKFITEPTLAVPAE